MDNIVEKKKADEPFYPEVSFNAITGECKISGESYMEEPNKFYYPLVDWLYKYTRELKRPVKLEIDLVYFNTATSKMLLQMFHVLKEYNDNGGEIMVTWYYDPEDDDMKDEIEDYILESGVDIKKLPME